MVEFTKGLFRAMNSSENEQKAERVMFDGFKKFKSAVERKEINKQQKKENELNEFTWKMNEDNIILKNAVLSLTQKLDISKRKNRDIDTLTHEL